MSTRNLPFIQYGMARSKKLEKIATRTPGEPNPFIVGEKNHQRLMKLLDECMKIQIARLNQSGS